MNDVYKKELISKLSDENSWWPKEFSDDFTSFIVRVDKQADQDSIINKISSIFIKQQATHQMVKDLISLSQLYVQGELFPTKFEPSFDGGKEQMSGWYVGYYESHCIDCDGKDAFLKHVKQINKIRNDVAHKLLGKNDSMIGRSYKKFEVEFTEAVCIYNDRCIVDLMSHLRELNKRLE